jgi:hypothetical protein
MVWVVITEQEWSSREGEGGGKASYSPPYLVDRAWCIHGREPLVVVEVNKGVHWSMEGR